MKINISTKYYTYVHTSNHHPLTIISHEFFQSTSGLYHLRQQNSPLLHSRPQTKTLPPSIPHNGRLDGGSPPGPGHPLCLQIAH